MPPPPTVAPDDFLPLGKYNPKFVEAVIGRTQKDSFIGERLLKFENTFRVGTNGKIKETPLTSPDQEYLFECSSEEEMKVWIGLVTDTIVALLKSRKYFSDVDPDATFDQIVKDVPPAWSGLLKSELF